MRSITAGKTTTMVWTQMHDSTEMRAGNNSLHSENGYGYMGGPAAEADNTGRDQALVQSVETLSCHVMCICHSEIRSFHLTYS